jgi:hypothetical protein
MERAIGGKLDNCGFSEQGQWALQVFMLRKGVKLKQPLLAGNIDAYAGTK